MARRATRVGGASETRRNLAVAARAAGAARARCCRVAIELSEGPEACRRSGPSMTGAVLLWILLAATPVPTPVPTSTPLQAPTPEKRDPHLIAALESRQGLGMERVALFDDGSLVRVREFRSERIVDRKGLGPGEGGGGRGGCP